MASSLSKNLSSAFRVAIIGGGVSGCAAARRLAQLDPSAKITLFEIGRGVGGRASTRKTRSMPLVGINHGSPYAELVSKEGRALVSSLGGGAVVPFVGREGCMDAATGVFSVNPDNEDRQLVTGSSGGLSELSSALIEGLPSIKTQFGTIVKGLSYNNHNEWEIRDKTNEQIGVADWLVVAGSGVAHPRWSKTFGGDPPLVEASNKLQDGHLVKSLDAIASQTTSPVLAVFFVVWGEAAKEWLNLDYAVAKVENSSVVSKIVVQSVDSSSSTDDDDEEPSCSVVIHSTREFAVQNEGVYGATSSAAQVGDASSSASREQELIETMLSSLKSIPGIPKDLGVVGGGAKSLYRYGPLLHRWGNAFPMGDALLEELSFVPTCRVGFCGDYVDSSVENVRFGSLECALLTGTRIGDKIHQEQKQNAEL